MSIVEKYVQSNKDRFQEELFSFLKIPSVSTDHSKKKDVEKAAHFLANEMRAVGIESVKVYNTPGHPIVYGEKIVGKDKPTVLVYGHYDVQPPDPIELWDSPPFEPIIKKTKIHPEGAIFARGSCDDKGQLYMHVKAFEAMHELNLLTCNMKFMFEGEEEIGSVNLSAFCEENKELLHCDVVIISDTSMVAKDIPSITTGLRGLCYMEVEVTGPDKDLHSGVYGGAVANPINILCKMISGLLNSKKQITIPGFYDDVVELTSDERALMAQIPFEIEAYKEEIGVKAVEGENGFTSLERSSIRPSLDVNGIWGGYIEPGAKTVLPGKAFAKISMRLVPDQHPDKVAKLFQKHFKSLAPESVTVKVTAHHGGLPVVTPINTPEYEAARLAILESFGKEPVPQRSGGSIPIISLFEQILGVKSILMGFGLNSDAIHSPNEHFGLFNFFKGIQTIPLFYKHYGKLKEN